MTTHQAPHDHQETKDHITKRFGDWLFGDWSLFGDWNLMFGHSSCAGQTLAEYGLVLALVVAVAMGMSVYAKRGIQGVLKTAADNLSPYGFAEDPDGRRAQRDGMLQESGGATFKDGEPVLKQGTVLKRVSVQTTAVDRVIHEADQAGGGHARTIDIDSAASTGGGLGGIASYSEVLTEKKP